MHLWSSRSALLVLMDLTRIALSVTFSLNSNVYEYFSWGDMTESVKNIFGAILLSQLLGDMNFGWGDMNFISGEMNFGRKNVGAK